MTYRTLQRQIGYLAIEEDYQPWEIKLIFKNSFANGKSISLKNIERAIKKYRRVYSEK